MKINHISINNHTKKYSSDNSKPIAQTLYNSCCNNAAFKKSNNTANQILRLVYFSSINKSNKDKQNKIIKELLDSLGNIPDNKDRKYTFISNILATDFLTGKVCGASELGFEKSENIQKKAKELSQHYSKDLKIILEHIIRTANLLNSKTIPDELLTRKSWDIDVYKKLKSRNVYQILDERKNLYPNEQYSVSSIEYLGMISDEDFENTIYMYEKMGKDNPDSDITLIAKFCASTNRQTIDYILDNDLLNPENTDIGKNTKDLFDKYYEIKGDELRIIHKRGLLKKLPEREKCLDIEESKYLANEANSDDEWQIIKNRNLLGLKLKGGSYLDCETICELMEMEDDTFEKIAARGILDIVKEEQWKINALAELSDKDWQTLIDWGYDIDKIYDINGFLLLSESEKQKAKSRNIKFYDSNDFLMLRLSDEQWQQLTQRNPNNDETKYDTSSQIRLAKLTDIEYQNAQKRGILIQSSDGRQTFSELDEIIAKFDEIQYQKFQKRKINSISTYPEIKYKLTTMTDEQFGRIESDIMPFCEKCKKEDLARKYSSDKTIADYYMLAYLDEEKYKYARKFLGAQYFDIKNQLSAYQITQIVNSEAGIIESLLKIINPKNIIKASTGKCFTSEQIISFCKYTAQDLDEIAELSDYLLPAQILHCKDEGKLSNLSKSEAFLKNKRLIQKINCLENMNLPQKNTLTEYLLNLADTDYSNMPLKRKVNVLDILNSAKLNGNLTEDEKDMLKLDIHIGAIQESLSHIIKPTEVSNDAAIEFMKTFFDVNNPMIDKTIKEANFKQYGINGLPLRYSRIEFLDDLTDLLLNVSPSERQEIYKKLDIKIKKDKEGNISGYDGIIDLSQLNKEGLEGEIYKIAHKFIIENEVTTQNPQLDKILNSLIHAIPEYINTIGKIQDVTHSFSLDIHMLCALENALNNPNYQNLSSKDKFCLKFAVVMHDIAKQERINNQEHPILCALYVRDILNKKAFKLPKEYKDRIIEMVKNHHWLAEYNLHIKDAKHIAAQFRRNGDLQIAQIVTEADIKAIDGNNTYYNMFKDALEDSMQKPVQQAVDDIHKSGQIILTSKIIDKNKIPQVEYKGKRYRVIDFKRLAENTDLSEYGFEIGTTTDNLRLIVHMVGENKLYNVISAHYLSDPNNQGFLSGSLVSLKNNNTYLHNKFGVSIETENVNIANASSKNQLSGKSKNFSNFVDILSNDDTQSSNRRLISDYIKNYLDLNDEEYCELYKKIQDIKYSSQLNIVRYISAGNKKISTNELKKAIQEANDQLFTLKNNHNETLLYCPKINAVVAKADSLDELPQKILDFAQKYDFPIFLL